MELCSLCGRLRRSKVCRRPLRDGVDGIPFRSAPAISMPGMAVAADACDLGPGIASTRRLIRR